METISTDSAAAISSSVDVSTSPNNPIIYVSKGTIVTNVESIHADIVTIQNLDKKPVVKIAVHKAKVLETSKNNEKEIQRIVVANNPIIKFHFSQQSSEEFFSSSEVTKGSALSQIPNGKIKAVLSYNLYFYNRFATSLFYTKTSLYTSDSHSEVFRARPPPVEFNI
ncbi:MAG: hypothetical protein KBS61_05500 [Chryseobacterium sp.]|nr:hypothetical protein [Candidatus Chryseobacterium enterohippi]